MVEIRKEISSIAGISTAATMVQWPFFSDDVSVGCRFHDTSIMKNDIGSP